MSRYALLDGEFEFQPGSSDLVLRNKLGITDPREMELAETLVYLEMVERSLGSLTDDQTLTVTDINTLHDQWLGGIYPFAGQYRQVNVSKNGFAFCAAAYIPEQMSSLNSVLARNMPCLGMDNVTLAKALTEVHGEFILIHPYREGNGRLGRWIATMMATQAGHPILEFEAEAASRGREEYFAAVRRYAVDPSLLENWFLAILQKGLAP